MPSLQEMIDKGIMLPPDDFVDVVFGAATPMKRRV
jgi:hypothetical protein